jgi:hypothetical protein
MMTTASLLRSCVLWLRATLTLLPLQPAKQQPPHRLNLSCHRRRMVWHRLSRSRRQPSRASGGASSSAETTTTLKCLWLPLRIPLLPLLLLTMLLRSLDLALVLALRRLTPLRRQAMSSRWRSLLARS